MNKNITPLVGSSSFIKEIKTLVQTLSANNASVLIVGERGSGKRLVARHIHYSNSAKIDHFFEINCKSFDKDQIQAVFGDVSRLIAFDQRITLFVCHVEEMILELQKSFIEMIKKTAAKELDLKIICSTECSLEEKVANGKFLPELLSRLNTVVINVLPLRLHKEDIIPIAESYLTSFSKKSGLKFVRFSEVAKTSMLEHFWKGNVDELINSIQRAFIVGKTPVIDEADLGFINEDSVVNRVVENIADFGSDKSLKTAVDMFKKEYVTKILEENNWNQTRAARVLEIQRTYVIKLINELEIRKN